MATKKWYRRYIPAGLILKNGNKWWFQISINGKRHRQSLNTDQKTLAGHTAAQIYADLVQDTPEAKCNLSIDILVEQFVKHDSDSVAKHTAQYRRNHILNFLEFSSALSPDDITTAQVNKWIDNLATDPQNPKSAKTRKNYRASLSAFCNWLKSRGYIETNPVRDSLVPKAKPHKIVYMNRAEFDKAIKIAHQKKLWAIFPAAYAGLRRAEILSLRWEDIDLESQTMTITGKGNKTAGVPINSKLKKVFQEIGVKKSGRVFPSMYTKLAATTYLKPLYKHCPTLAQTGQGWHVFRRHFDSLLVQNVVSIAQVSKLMRHSSVTTTERHYAHLIAEHGRDAIELL